MKTYIVIFSYDGSNYYGFQKQKGLPTIEEELEKALYFINNKMETKFFASGRTDAKVHALYQVGHVTLTVKITPSKLRLALNSKLPKDIYIKEIVEAPSNFHARYSPKIKTYRYYINMGMYDPIKRNYVYQYGKNLNLSLIKQEAEKLIGKHDFTSFCSIDTSTRNKTRTITKLIVEEQPNNQIALTISGTGFLKQMVRKIVGHLILVGSGKKFIETKQLLLSKNPKLLEFTAPPEGLYLEEIDYK